MWKILFQFDIRWLTQSVQQIEGHRAIQVESRLRAQVVDGFLPVHWIVKRVYTLTLLHFGFGEIVKTCLQQSLDVPDCVYIRPVGQNIVAQLIGIR